ncbi:hypothetical protein [Escherichia fergusonii]
MMSLFGNLIGDTNAHFHDLIILFFSNRPNHPREFYLVTHNRGGPE